MIYNVSVVRFWRGGGQKHSLSSCPLKYKTQIHECYKLSIYQNSTIVVRWPDQGTPQNFWETILLHFLIDMMVPIKNQEGVEV